MVECISKRRKHSPRWKQTVLDVHFHYYQIWTFPVVGIFLPSFSLELKGIVCTFIWGNCSRFNAFQDFVSPAWAVRRSAPWRDSLLGFPPPRHRWSPNPETDDIFPPFTQSIKKTIKLVVHADYITSYLNYFHLVITGFYVFRQSHAIVTQMLFCETIPHCLSCRRFLATTVLFVVSRPSAHDSEYKSLLQILCLSWFYPSILCDIIQNCIVSPSLSFLTFSTSTS